MRQWGRKRPCKDNEQGLIPGENEQNLHFAPAHNLRFSVSLRTPWIPSQHAAALASRFRHIKKVRRSPQKIFHRRERHRVYWFSFDSVCFEAQERVLSLTVNIVLIMDSTRRSDYGDDTCAAVRFAPGQNIYIQDADFWTVQFDRDRTNVMNFTLSLFWRRQFVLD